MSVQGAIVSSSSAAVEEVFKRELGNRDKDTRGYMHGYQSLMGISIISMSIGRVSLLQELRQEGGSFICKTRFLECV